MILYYIQDVVIDHIRNLWIRRNICKKKSPVSGAFVCSLERETRLELATPTLARLCSTNWAILACDLISQTWCKNTSNFSIRQVEIEKN